MDLGKTFLYTGYNLFGENHRENRNQSQFKNAYIRPVKTQKSPD